MIHKSQHRVCVRVVKISDNGLVVYHVVKLNQKKKCHQNFFGEAAADTKGTSQKGRVGKKANWMTTTVESRLTAE